jgi:hypothetical protein
MYNVAYANVSPKCARYICMILMSSHIVIVCAGSGPAIRSCVVGKCLFALCAHYNGIKRGTHSPVPNHATIIANPSKFLITAAEFIDIVQQKKGPKINLTFSAKNALIKALVNGGVLPDAKFPTESGVEDGREESMAVHLRTMDAQDTTGESAPPVGSIDEHSGDEQEHNTSGVKGKDRMPMEVDDPQSSNIMTVLKVVDQIAAMHGGREDSERKGESIRWLSDEFNMSPIKDSLYNLHNAVDTQTDPNPNLFANVQEKTDSVLRVHRQAITDLVG